MENTRSLSCGKMCREPCPQTPARTSEGSSKNSAASANQTLQFLDLRNGASLVPSWENLGVWDGEFWTLNIGESPNAAVESSLSSILEDEVPWKYYLSEKGASGILRRSEEKGKPLPDILKFALKNTIAIQRWKSTAKTSEFPWQEITLYKPSQDAWVLGGGMSQS